MLPFSDLIDLIIECLRVNHNDFDFVVAFLGADKTVSKTGFDATIDVFLWLLCEFPCLYSPASCVLLSH